jgi:hypothetical protein
MIFAESLSFAKSFFAAELRRRELHQLPQTWVNKRRLAELKKPKQRPAR